MSELEEIKVRAAERRPKMNSTFTPCTEAEADLDRAIAIAENMLAIFDFAAMERTADKMHQFAEERDEARAEVDALKVKLAAAGVVIEEQAETIVALHKLDEYACAEELDEARTAALLLRETMKEVAECPAMDDGWAVYDSVHARLVETEWLEQHRSDHQHDFRSCYDGVYRCACGEERTSSEMEEHR